MSPEDVNPEWVEKALNTRLPSGGLPTLNEPQMRAILAAVLPLVQAAALAKHLDAYIEWQPRMGDSNAAFATLREMAAEVNRLREGSPS